MNKKILLASSLIFVAIASACGSQTTQTPLETAIPTETLSQPTQAPDSTNTPLPPSTTLPPVIDVSTEAPATNVSFSSNVLPILNNSCIKCHGVDQIKEGLDLRSYDTLMAGSFNGTVITPGNADDSFLFQQIIQGEMPNRGPKLTAEQIQIIADWINAGAQNN